MVSSGSLAAIFNSQCEPLVLCSSPWCCAHPLGSHLHPSVGSRLQSSSMCTLMWAKRLGSLPLVKCLSFLTCMSPGPLAEAEALWDAQSSCYGKFPVLLPGSFFTAQWLLIFLKAVSFQWAVIVHEQVAYSSGPFVLKIYPYPKHLNTPCFQNCTRKLFLARNAT